MFGSNIYVQNGNGNVPLFNNNGEQDNMKINHDSYNVYVNRDFVGSKTLLAQNEKITDIDDYLKNQGLRSFASSLMGNDYVIDSGGQEEQRIKKVLDVYLNIR